MKRSNIVHQFVEASMAFNLAEHHLRLKKYSGLQAVKKSLGESDAPVVVRGSVKAAKTPATDTEVERLRNIRDAWRATYLADTGDRSIKKVARDLKEARAYLDKYTSRLDKADKGSKKRKNLLRVAVLTDLVDLYEDEQGRVAATATPKAGTAGVTPGVTVGS